MRHKFDRSCTRNFQLCQPCFVKSTLHSNVLWTLVQQLGSTRVHALERRSSSKQIAGQRIDWDVVVFLSGGFRVVQVVHGWPLHDSAIILFKLAHIAVHSPFAVWEEVVGEGIHGERAAQRAPVLEADVHIERHRARRVGRPAHVTVLALRRNVEHAPYAPGPHHVLYLDLANAEE